MKETVKPTIEVYPLEKRKIVKKTVKVMTFVTILFAVVFAFTAMFSLVLVALEFLFYAGLFLIVYFYEVAYFKAYYYDIREDFLVIKKGVVAPREISLPYNKFQDVYLDQDVFDRIFSLWDLHVSTATFMSGLEAHIDGVSRENGETMKKMLLGKIQEANKK